MVDITTEGFAVELQFIQDTDVSFSWQATSTLPTDEVGGAQAVEPTPTGALTPESIIRRSQQQ